MYKTDVIFLQHEQNLRVDQSGMLTTNQPQATTGDLQYTKGRELHEENIVWASISVSEQFDQRYRYFKDRRVLKNIFLQIIHHENK